MNEAAIPSASETVYRQRIKNQSAQAIIKLLEHVLELAQDAGQLGMAADIADAVTAVKERHASNLRQTLEDHINKKI